MTVAFSLEEDGDDLRLEFCHQRGHFSNQALAFVFFFFFFSWKAMETEALD